MSNVVKTDIDALNAVLKVTVPKSIYLKKVKKDINKYAQQSTMKGFRPGKTPQNLVKKLYGREFLMDAINETVADLVKDFMNGESRPTIGQPIPSIEQPRFTLNLSDPQDVEMSLDIAYFPEIDFSGFSPSIDSYKIVAKEEAISAELAVLQKQAGEEQETTELIAEGDVITLDAKEVGGSIEREIVVAYDWLTDDMKSVFSTQRTGDTLQVNIFQLEKETTSEYVRKYFLDIPEDDEREINENFDVTVKTVKRRTKAALDEAFFSKYFGGDIKNEEEARKILGIFLLRDQNNKAASMRYFQLKQLALETLTFDMPNAFIKRMIVLNDNKLNATSVEETYPLFEEQLRWRQICDQILVLDDVSVSREDVKSYLIDRYSGYFGAQVNSELLENIAERAIQNEKEYESAYGELTTLKALVQLEKRATINYTDIDEESFEGIFKAFDELHSGKKDEKEALLAENQAENLVETETED